MTQLSPEQVADLRRKIEARYVVLDYDFKDGSDPAWMVAYADSLIPINDNDHDDPLDAEAEMEAIIQDEIAATMEAEEEEEPAMIDPDHAKRVLEHQRETPRQIIAKALRPLCVEVSPIRLIHADAIIEALVLGGYAIEPIEDDDE